MPFVMEVDSDSDSDSIMSTDDNEEDRGIYEYYMLTLLYMIDELYDELDDNKFFALLRDGTGDHGKRKRSLFALDDDMEDDIKEEIDYLQAMLAKKIRECRHLYSGRNGDDEVLKKIEQFARTLAMRDTTTSSSSPPNPSPVHPRQIRF